MKRDPKFLDNLNVDDIDGAVPRRMVGVTPSSFTFSTLEPDQTW